MMRWLRKCRPQLHDTRDSERAQYLLNKARADEPRVARIVEDTKTVLHRNNLGPKIQIALGVRHR